MVVAAAAAAAAAAIVVVVEKRKQKENKRQAKTSNKEKQQVQLEASPCSLPMTCRTQPLGSADFWFGGGCGGGIGGSNDALDVGVATSPADADDSKRRTRCNTNSRRLDAGLTPTGAGDT